MSARDGGGPAPGGGAFGARAVARVEEGERPPPVLGRWRNLYLLEVIVLAGQILLFVWLGRVYG